MIWSQLGRLSECRFDFNLRRTSSTQEGVSQDGSTLANFRTSQTGEVIGGSHGGPGVSRNRRYPQVQSCVVQAQVCPIPVLVKMIQHSHAGNAIERGAAGKDELTRTRLSDSMFEDVEQCILKHHLGGSRFVDTFLSNRSMLDVFHSQHMIGVPHFRWWDRWSRGFAAAPSYKVAGCRRGAS